MADDVTTGELSRQLDGIRRVLDSVVGHPEYAADKRGLDYRFAEISADVEELRRQHVDDIRDVNTRITAQEKAAKQDRMAWTDRLWQGALPALVAAIGVLVTILIQHGGH